MWSNVISIDKSEKGKFKRLLSGVKEIGELSCAVEESKYRNFIYMAGLCEYADGIRGKIEELVADVILTDYKLAYYLDNLHYGSLSYAVAALLSTLIYLDYDLEKAFTISTLREMASYEVDGVYNFRMKTVKSGWREIADMCNHLFEVGTDETDIYNVISYISATKTQRPTELVLKGEIPALYDGAGQKEIKIRKLYGIFDYDLINAVIASEATKLTIDGATLNKETVRALRHIVRVKVN